MNTKILYIDNDIASYILVSEILEGCNVEIIHTRCGLLAIQMFKLSPIDLIITELILPNMDGFGILREVRKNDPQVPVIAQTANVVNNMKYTCLNAGFNEYIPKPIDLKYFTSILNKYIQNSNIMEFEDSYSQQFIQK